MMVLKSSMDDLPAEALDQVIDRTDGVPLFVEEFTNMLLESGTIERIRNQTAETSGSFAPIEADPAATAEAESCFQEAIQIAQQQSSRSMQLRAMMSLAALWHGQGRTQEAHMMLQMLYITFTEGLQTPDLLRARELLASMQ